MSRRALDALPCAILALAWGGLALAQPATQGARPAGMETAAPTRAAGAASRPAVPTTVPSRVVAVTVYQGNALVTREVDVPGGSGTLEIVVTPLPPQVVDSSLYSEGSDGLRVLSTRFRSRALQFDTREEVRRKEQEIARLQAEQQALQKQLQVTEENLRFLAKLENFTTASMSQLMEKGRLNGQTTIDLAKFVMEQRNNRATTQVSAQQQVEKIGEQMQFAQRQLNELAAGSSHTESDAVIVLDKANAGPGKVRLNYLVSNATWTPQYRFHAGSDKDPVQLEYLAAIEQQSGEDWFDADVVLSTAQPQLNAAPPELLALDIQVGGRRGVNATAGASTQPFLGRGNYEYTQNLRRQGQAEFNSNKSTEGRDFINDAAALEQTQQLLSAKEEKPGEAEEAAGPQQGPSVTYHLRQRHALPSRTDQELIEVARIVLAPDYFYKTVPVLSPQVYRQAMLENKSDYVLLPGEATMYVGRDFVGRMRLPLVAIGERFTVGFGVDPQLQVDRQLVSKARAVQGGNQVHNFTYRIRVGSYKSAPANVQVWDRLPRGEAESVGVTLGDVRPKPSEDARYVRAEKPQNLLRWDMTVKPGENGESAATIEYSFRLEYARDVSVGNFKAAK